MRLKYFLLLLALAVALSACDEKTTDESSSIPEPTAVTEPTATPVPIPAPEDEPDIEIADTVKAPNARIRTGVSDEYHDIYIEKGSVVTPPSRIGYTFRGYWDSPDGEKDSHATQYIDASGQVLLSYHGDTKLLLYPEYTADEYSIVLCKNGTPLQDFSKIICKYDRDIISSLPLGKKVLKDRIEDDSENYAVVGFADSHGVEIISPDTKCMTVADLLTKNAIDVEDHIVRLNVVTSDITALERRDSFGNGGNGKVTKDGFLKQNFGDEATYIVFDFSDRIDAAALAGIGYTNVKIKLTAQIGLNGSRPQICVLTDEAQKKGDVTKNAVLNTKVISKDKLNSEGYYEQTETIPIQDFIDASSGAAQSSNSLYVYCNADGLFTAPWTLRSLTLELSFT